MAGHREPGQQSFFLVDDREVVLTTAHDVACDGGGGALGHPIEYMTLGKVGVVVCKYCGRRYVHVDHAEAAAIRANGTPYAPPAAA